MKEQEDELRVFSLVCFCVLMGSTGTLEMSSGILTKAPDYILEKYSRIYDPRWAYNSLHPLLRPLVTEYGKAWGIDFERIIKEMDDDLIRLTAKEWDKKYTWKGL